eukprot:scaffold3796_cov84-Isochrysis_galbana.AAC.1
MPPGAVGLRRRLAGSHIASAPVATAVGQAEHRAWSRGSGGSGGDGEYGSGGGGGASVGAGGEARDVSAWPGLFHGAGHSRTALQALAHGEGRLLLIAVEGADLVSLRLVREVWPALAGALSWRVEARSLVAVRMDVGDAESAFWMGEVGASYVTPTLFLAWGKTSASPVPRSALRSAPTLLAHLDVAHARAMAAPFHPKRAARLLGRLARAREAGFPRPNLELPAPPADLPLLIPLGGG